MWSSGRGGDPERERCVRANDARKHAARRWMNQGREPPSSLLRRETEEYDRRHGRTPSSAAGSSSVVGSSSAMRGGGVSGAVLLPVKRKWVDEPEDRELGAVKQGPEEIARRGFVGPEDYVGDDVHAVAAAMPNGACARRRSAAARTRSSKTSCSSRRSRPTSPRKTRATSGGASARSRMQS
ncbi:CDPK-related protein kinase [Hordeum vulgare]|nr:CDPK-related protein kinase [Hordeum vulgare]